MATQSHGLEPSSGELSDLAEPTLLQASPRDWSETPFLPHLLGCCQRRIGIVFGINAVCEREGALEGSLREGREGG
eukprot:2722458-Rhodomonas_salina.1